eukprot:CAMPEP_0170477704 /NCGR_PEP_ID=MMETSP0123-20130129/18892_1 /TAXON_ID=182087 /ORGANISM="Favella ehrenbergii, Strain Fehren 1" /LENGTH=52 /DNA_ID=CAMNT_0010749555 /DNA_START=332 /DNA_END=490 /DNA_ORIENTATION=+
MRPQASYWMESRRLQLATKLNTSGVFEGFTISKSSASPDLKASPVTDAIEAE